MRSKTYIFFSHGLICLLCHAMLSSAPCNLARGQTFTGEGDWKSPERWDSGSIPVDGATVIINGISEISENIGVNNADNPSRIIIGQETEGVLTVTGGTLSGANGGSAGIFVGAGPGGVGRVNILPGTGLRTQGANMVLQVGDDEGGIGHVSVGGELLNYKFFRIVHGTLEMLPTGINNRFNQLNTISTIEPNGTLAFVIDGDQVGTLSRANGVGLNVDIFPGAQLDITLQGDVQLNQRWTLMRYHTLIGTFEQGTEFSNAQGFTFEIHYGSGEDDEVVLELTSTANQPSISSFSASPAGIASGGTAILEWSVGAFTSLEINPEVGNVSAVTTQGKGSVEIAPVSTTSYQLTLKNNAATVTAATTVVVDAAPIITSFSAHPEAIAPGETATLHWDVLGADSVLIQPSVGEVHMIGTADVQPDATTTYILTATNHHGSSTMETGVKVDAIDAALILSFDAAGPKQASGAVMDVLGGASFDLKNTHLSTDISTFTTNLKASYQLTSLGGGSGGDGNSLPGGKVTYEAWVRPDHLDINPQVIFETGGNTDGCSMLISESSVRFLNSQNGERTHDLEVSISDIELSDFVQIVVSLDQDTGDIHLYVRGASGGFASTSGNAPFGPPNGRASLFNWTNFSANVAGALGGIGSEVPEGVTLYTGELALLNVYDRPLTAPEIEDTFLRIAIPDPGLIQSFTATPDRANSGDPITIAWNVEPFQTLMLMGPGGGNVAAMTENGVGNLEIRLSQSAQYTLIAEGDEGVSTSSLLILIDVAADVVVLKTSTDTWETSTAWSDDQVPQSARDYLVTDFLASSLGVPAIAEAEFPGSSIEILGQGARLNIQNDITERVYIKDLRLSGGMLDLTGNEGSTILEGGLTIRQDSQIDITGTYNALTIDSQVSGSGGLRVTAAATSLEEDETLVLNGNNRSFSGDWTLVGGKTFVASPEALGTGTVHLLNANLEINAPIKMPEAALILEGMSALALFENATFKGVHFRLTDGTAVTMPAGSYDFGTWTSFSEELGLDSLQLDLLAGSSLTVLENNPLPTAGTEFTGEGDWFSVTNWSDGIPSDGGNAIINGVAEITSNIGTSNSDNPSRIFVGDQETGVLTVTGGTLSGAHSGTNAGIFVGLGPDGNGSVHIEEGAALRSQGGGMVVQIGDETGGSGHVSVAGQLFNYKFFRIINGTLEMLPTGINQSFNSADVSTIASNGTLAFKIEGDQVGGLLRSNDNGLNLEIDPQANLTVQLTGSMSEGDTWALIDYTSLVGSFAQGEAFTNEQGHQFALEYGSGTSDLVTLTLTKLNPDAVAPSVEIIRLDDRLQVIFTGNLESASEVDGPYTTVEEATSPYSVSVDAPRRFYRASR
jgi:hypothetical protein